MRLRFGVKVVLCLLALSGAMYLFVSPLRTYLAQERQVRQVERTIAVVGAQNAKLSAEKKLLQRTSYVDQLARADYGYVRPGQQAYEVLPPAKRVRRDQPLTQRGDGAGTTAHKYSSSSR